MAYAERDPDKQPLADVAIPADPAIAADVLAGDDVPDDATVGEALSADEA